MMTTLSVLAATLVVAISYDVCISCCIICSWFLHLRLLLSYMQQLVSRHCSTWSLMLLMSVFTASNGDIVTSNAWEVNWSNSDTDLDMGFEDIYDPMDP